MRSRFFLLLPFALAAGPVFAADPVGQVFDQQVSSVEREVLPLVEAMPADKFDFAPTNGAFAGVRTFALQARHDATIIWRISASVLGEQKPPVDTGSGDNGPDSLKTKDQIVDYFRNAIAYAHKAMGSLTEQNMLDQVPSPFGFGKSSRLAAAAFLGLHSYDHYGQMVEYARMNGVIPPASAGRGPAPGRARSAKSK